MDLALAPRAYDGPAVRVPQRMAAGPLVVVVVVVVVEV